MREEKEFAKWFKAGRASRQRPAWAEAGIGRRAHSRVWPEYRQGES